MQPCLNADGTIYRHDPLAPVNVGDMPPQQLSYYQAPVAPPSTNMPGILPTPELTSPVAPPANDITASLNSQLQQMSFSTSNDNCSVPINGPGMCLSPQGHPMMFNGTSWQHVSPVRRDDHVNPCYF